MGLGDKKWTNLKEENRLKILKSGKLIRGTGADGVSFSKAILDHICSDKKYGFECSCYEGFELSSATPNRGKCEDVNECNAGKTICGEHEFCSNLVGSYECLCKDGFKKDVLKAIGSSNFIGCVDIDECKKNPCAVNEICSNTGT